MRTYEIKYVNWNGETHTDKVQVNNDEDADDAKYKAILEIEDGVSHIIECEEIFQ